MNETSRVEHYPQHPSADYGDKYKLGLAGSHYLLNDTTNLTSYCLINYGELKDIKGCS